MTIQPIELPDDGLHNPGLIAEVAAIKAMRRVIRAANERAFA